jgi:hypothetical protein
MNKILASLLNGTSLQQAIEKRQAGGIGDNENAGCNDKYTESVQ